MKIPKGFTIGTGYNKTHVLKLIQNIYGQKQAGRIWNKYLHRILLELGWVQSKVDNCLYYKGDILFLVYVNDGILVAPVDEHIKNELKIFEEEI
jgi:Reverse transcriptase (RNA-dependent DNA polymerase)